MGIGCVGIMMSSNRTEIGAAWIVALALIALMVVHAFLPQTPPRLPFLNDHTGIVCARLDIRLLHAKPYHAWSKGKVERVCFTIQQAFEAGLCLPDQSAATLEELNAKFSFWLQSVYHARIHSSTGMTPAERYQRGAHLVKALDPHLDLDQLFYHQVTRTCPPRRQRDPGADRQGFLECRWW